MAYAIASLADGGVLYSDGSKRYPASTNQGTQYYSYSGATESPQSYQQNLTTQPTQPTSSTVPGGTGSPAPSKRSYSIAPRSINYTPVNYELPKNSFTDLISKSPLYEKYLNIVPQGIRQGAGNALDAFSKLGWEQFNSGKPWQDTGFSELIAGGATSGTAYAGTPRPSDIATDSSFSQSINNFNKLPATGYGDQYQINARDFSEVQGLFNDANADFDALRDNPYTTDYGADDATGLNQDLYALADDIGQQGFSSQEDAEKAYAEARIDRIMQDYTRLTSDANALIPRYERFEEQGVRDLTQGLTDLQETGEEKRGNIEETYGASIRRGVKNKQLLDARRRNMFSGLGTAESSSFIESQTGADKDFLSGIGTTEREMASKMSNIDNELIKAERQTTNQINDLKADTRDKIINIQRSIDLSEGEKRSRIDEVYAELSTNLSGLVADYNDKQASLINARIEMAGSLNLINRQGQIDQGLLAGQFALENQANTLSSQMPAGLDQEIRGFLKRPQSGQATNEWAKLLKTKYPEWTDLIDGVITGQVGESQLNNFGSSIANYG